MVFKDGKNVQEFAHIDKGFDLAYFSKDLLLKIHLSRYWKFLTTAVSGSNSKQGRRRGYGMS